MRVAERAVDVGRPGERQHDPPQATAEQPREQRQDRGEHDEEAEHVEHPRPHAECEPLADGVPRRRVVEQPGGVDVEVVHLPLRGRTCRPGAAVGERGDHRGIHAGDQAERVDEHGQEQGHQVDLAGPTPADHRGRPLPDPAHERLVDHAEHDARQHHEHLRTGHGTHGVERHVRVEAGELGVGDDHREDQPAAEEVDPQVPAAGVPGVAPGRDPAPHEPAQQEDHGEEHDAEDDPAHRGADLVARWEASLGGRLVGGPLVVLPAHRSEIDGRAPEVGQQGAGQARRADRPPVHRLVGDLGLDPRQLQPGDRSDQAACHGASANTSRHQVRLSSQLGDARRTAGLYSAAVSSSIGCSAGVGEPVVEGVAAGAARRSPRPRRAGARSSPAGGATLLPTPWDCRSGTGTGPTQSTASSPGK